MLMPSTYCAHAQVAFEGVGSMPMERINSYRARKQREVDREMAERQARANLRAAVAEGRFVVGEGEAELLARNTGGGGGRDGSSGSEAGGGGAGAGAPGVVPRTTSASGGRWVSQLAVLGSKAKDTLDRGRMRITHRRGQSLGASPAALEGLEAPP